MNYIYTFLPNLTNRNYIISTLLIFLLYISPSSSYAIEMNEISVGETLYLDGFMNNPKITVIDKDYSDNTIKIKKPNGSVEWVKASKLMGNTGKIFDDMLQDIGKEIAMSAMKSTTETGFTLCNESGSSFHAILGVNSIDNGVITHGHFSLINGECNKLTTGELTYRYYYIHLSKDGSNILEKNDSDKLFCIDPTNAFKALHAEKSCKNGKKDVYFKVVDTGKKARAFKYTIN